MIELTVERYTELITKEHSLEILLNEIGRTFSTSFERVDHIKAVCKMLFDDLEVD